MALTNVVKYTDTGLKISRPEEGERHLVYIRPRDVIEFDFDDKDINFRLVDGDVIAVLPDSSQLIFLQLGSLSLGAEESPKLITNNGEEIEVLSRVEVSPLIDQEKEIANKFLEFQTASQKHDIEEQSLSKQRELLEQTLESVSQYVAEVENAVVAGPIQRTEADGNQRSGDQSTVDFVQETVERVIRAPESTTIPEPEEISQASQSLTQQNDEVSPQTALPQLSSQFDVSLDVLKVAQRTTTNSAGVVTSAGGTGSILGSSNPSITAQLQDEIISLTSSNANQIVRADDVSNVGGTNELGSQVIRINPSLPDGFNIQSITVSGFGGATLYNISLDSDNLTNPNSNSITLERNTDFTSDEGILVMVQFPITATQFSAQISATATFDTASGFETPAETTISTVSTIRIDVHDIASLVPEAAISILEDAAADNNTEVFSSSATNNVIATGIGNDVIVGGIRQDTITANAGDDHITGNLGNDTIDGGEGVDTVYYSNVSQADAAAGSNLGDAVQSAIDSDFGYATSNGITVNLGEIDSIANGVIVEVTANDRDVLRNIENIVGTSFSDTLIGSTDANYLRGGAGDDTLAGGGGDDTLDGGSGSDTADFSAATADITIADLDNNGSGVATGEGTDTLIGIENIMGGAGNDSLRGNASNNSIDGGAGNDTIQGGGGADTLIGGSGEDTIDFSWSVNGLVIDFAGDQTQSSVSGTVSSNNGASFSLFENVRGTSANDTLITDDNNNTIFITEGVDTINGNGGGDTIDFSDAIITASDFSIDLTQTINTYSNGVGSSGNVSNVEHVIGGNGNDTIAGNGADNSLTGGDGNDMVLGSQGDDVISGGNGEDTLDYSNLTNASGTAPNLVIDLSAGTANKESAGNDSLTGIENIIGGSGEDTFTGNTDNNILNGGEGNDTFNYLLGSNHGNDTFMGGGGTDTLNLSSGALPIGAVNTIDLQASITVGGNTFSDLLGNQTLLVDAIENVSGTSQADVIIGDGNNNTLNGNDGSDTLDGGSGADVLNGGAGDDVLIGGSGDDFFDGGLNVDWLDFGSTNTARANIVADLRSSAGTNNISQNGFGGVDTATNIENIRGGSGNDTIILGLEDAVAIGGLGNDSISISGRGEGAQLFGDTVDNIRDLTQGGQDAGQAAQVALTGGGDVVDFSHLTANHQVLFDLNNASGQFNVSAFSIVDTDGDGLFIDDIVSPVTGNAIGFEQVIGSAGNDVLIGADNARNTLQGGDGNDFVRIGANSGGRYDGGAGNSDTIDFSQITQDLNINLLSGTVTGATNAINIDNFEHITGSGQNDFIIGDSNANTILAGIGDDSITGSSGADFIDGGIGGIDSLSYAGSTDALVLDESNTLGTSLQITFDNSATQTITNIERFAGSSVNDTFTLNATVSPIANLTLIDGFAGDDTFTIQSLANGNTIIGGAGDDTVSFLQQVIISAGTSANSFNVNAGTGVTATSFVAGDFETFTLSGNNDIFGSVVGSSGTNLTIDAGGGNDTFTGGAGDDTFNGDGGIDLGDYSGQSISQIAVINASSITVSGANLGQDTLNNTEELMLGSGDDTLTVSALNGTEISNIDAGLGRDSITFDNVALITGIGDSFAVDLNGDSDTVDLSDIQEISGIEELIGSSMADNLNLSGYTNSILLNGRNGDDIINGGSASDTLIGGAGADTLNGGGGNDVIILEADGNTLTNSAGIDTVDYSSVASNNVLGFTVNNITDSVISGNLDNDTLQAGSFENLVLNGANNIGTVEIDALGMTPDDVQNVDLGGGNDFVTLTGSATQVADNSINGDFFSNVETVDLSSSSLNTASDPGSIGTFVLNLSNLRNWASDPDATSDNNTRTINLSMNVGDIIEIGNSAIPSTGSDFFFFENQATSATSNFSGINAAGQTTLTAGQHSFLFLDSVGDSLQVNIDASVA